MRCPSCQKESQQDSVFCPYCGSRMTQKTAQQNKKAKLLVLLILCVIGMILTVIIFRKHTEQKAEISQGQTTKPQTDQSNPVKENTVPDITKEQIKDDTTPDTTKDPATEQIKDDTVKLFDETCWLWALGPNFVEHEVIKFHLDGTYETIFYAEPDGIFRFGTYEYHNGTLTLWDGTDYLNLSDGEQYILKEDGTFKNTAALEFSCDIIPGYEDYWDTYYSTPTATTEEEKRNLALKAYSKLIHDGVWLMGDGTYVEATHYELFDMDDNAIPEIILYAVDDTAPIPVFAIYTYKHNTAAQIADSVLSCDLSKWYNAGSQLCIHDDEYVYYHASKVSGKELVGTSGELTYDGKKITNHKLPILDDEHENDNVYCQELVRTFEIVGGSSVRDFDDIFN